MGWNTYVLIVVLRISRKNKVLQMGILKGQCRRDSFDVVSSAPFWNRGQLVCPFVDLSVITIS
jgi:hypothetical protein